MNAQLPSGLQALLQASQVLQQQAAPTAPGPQGPQPTVANKVAQQIEQVAAPGMADMGQQAGIAGQIMAQRQAQQQQMAQNPQAVAQMAAQMLQGQGVAGLPANFQFKEGGIIGFSGEEQSDVPDPEAGMTLAERQDYLRRKKGSIYSPTFGLDPDEAAVYLADVEAQRAGTANPEMGPVVGGEVPRTAEERKRIAEQNARLQRIRENAAAIGRSREERVSGIEAVQGRQEAAQAAAEAAKPAAAGAERIEQYDITYPKRGGMKVSDSGGIASVAPEEVGPPKRLMEATRDIVKPPPGGIAQGTPTAPPAETPPIPPSPPVTSVPEAKMPTRAGVQQVLERYQTPKAIAKAQAEVQAVGQRILEARNKQEDLESQGIAALTRAEQARQQQLQQARQGDDFTRLRAFFRDLATRGNTYDAAQAGIDAREAGNIKAGLAHEQAVIELKKAKQARELGNLEAERTHKANALAFMQSERKIKQDLAKLDLDTQAIYDKLTGEERTALANRQTTSQVHAADRASRERIENAKLIQMARDAKDVKLANQLAVAGSKVTEAYKLLESLPEKYPFVKMPVSEEQLKKDPAIKAKFDEYQAARANIENNVIRPAIAERNRLAAQLSGGAAPSAGSTVVRYDKSGNKID